jgi:hypothetical protein
MYAFGGHDLWGSLVAVGHGVRVDHHQVLTVLCYATKQHYPLKLKSRQTSVVRAHSARLRSRMAHALARQHFYTSLTKKRKYIVAYWYNILTAAKED